MNSASTVNSGYVLLDRLSPVHIANIAEINLVYKKQGKKIIVSYIQGNKGM